ncbi:MAG: hypothetical protein HRT74_09100 [Flavobacteriales bacterium]|nr:hypothetical protein [Flavobacteriales bacterium]
MSQPTHSILKKNETIIWEGKCVQKDLFTTRNVVIVLVASLLLLLSLYGFFSGAQIFGLRLSFGFPVILLSTILVVTRFFLDRHTRRGLTYVVTNDRVVIFREKDPINSPSIEYKDLNKVTLVEHKNGFGTIYFNDPETMVPDNGGHLAFYSEQKSQFRFENIPNAEETYRIIMKTQQSFHNYPS